MKILENNNNLKAIQKNLSMGDGVGFKMISGSKVNSYMTAASELLSEIKSGEYDDRTRAAAVENFHKYIEAAREAISDVISDAQQLIVGCQSADSYINGLEKELD